MKKEKLILKAVLSVSILLYLFAMLTAFLIVTSDIVEEVLAETVATTVTVPKEVNMGCFVPINDCNECIKLCEGRHRCKETCFNLICK